MFKNYFLLLALFCALSIKSQPVPYVQLSEPTDALLKNVINEINKDSIQSYMQWLQDMGTRFCFSDNRKIVAENILQKFESFGYSNVNLQPYNYYYNNDYGYFNDQYNVVCETLGVSNKTIVIGAHHDAVSGSPGADDNGSGTAAVLEIARVFKKLNLSTTHNLKFITFSAEEVGLIGSKYSAAESFFRNEDISMMVNMDMIANSSQDSLSVFKVNFSGASEPFFQIISSVSDVYLQMKPYYLSSGSSDHLSYRSNGYRSVYFQEFEFSPVYHSYNDLVVNTNATYASRIVKSIAASIFALDNVAELPLLQVINAGKGTDVIVDGDIGEEFNEFDIYYKQESASNFKLKSGVSNLPFSINDLLPDTNYEFYFYFTDDNFNRILSSKYTVKTNNNPDAPEDIEVYGLESSIQIKWSNVYQSDVKGFNVYEYNGGSFHKMNASLIDDLIYEISDITDEKYHYYCVSAVDENGNESIKSQIESAKLGRDLFVNDSIEINIILDISSAVSLQNEIKNFFNQVFDGFNFEINLYTSETDLNQEFLNKSKVIIWYAPGFPISKSLYKKNFNKIIEYLHQGGKLLLSTSDANYATSLFKRNLPSQIMNSNAAFEFLKTQKVDYIPQSWFEGANSTNNKYPDLFFNYETAPSSYIDSEYLKYVHSVEPNSNANVIYTYNSPYPSDVNHGKMQGLPVGIEYLGDDFALVFLSFPISFMAFDEASAFLQEVVTNQFNYKTTDINEENKEFKDLAVFPNPTRGNVNIKVYEDGCLIIFNTLGQIVLQKNVFAGQINFNLKKYGSGVYYINHQGVRETVIKKVIVK